MLATPAGDGAEEASLASGSQSLSACSSRRRLYTMYSQDASGEQESGHKNTASVRSPTARLERRRRWLYQCLTIAGFSLTCVIVWIRGGTTWGIGPSTRHLVQTPQIRQPGLEVVSHEDVEGLGLGPMDAAYDPVVTGLTFKDMSWWEDDEDDMRAATGPRSPAHGTSQTQDTVAVQLQGSKGAHPEAVQAGDVVVQSGMLHLSDKATRAVPRVGRSVAAGAARTARGGSQDGSPNINGPASPRALPVDRALLKGKAGLRTLPRVTG